MRRLPPALVFSAALLCCGLTELSVRAQSHAPADAVIVVPASSKEDMVRFEDNYIKARCLKCRITSRAIWVEGQKPTWRAYQMVTYAAPDGKQRTLWFDFLGRDSVR